MATVAQAIRMALAYAEDNLELKDVFGEDVGPPLGGAFTVTQGLKTSWNSPLDERGIIGMATGLGMAGSRCVAEIQFCDYIYNTIDLLKLAGNACWTSMGQYPVPMVVMTPVGSGIHGSVYHSHSFDSKMVQIPGWKTVMPSNAYDAFGLMLAAIKDPNPVMFLKPKALLRAKGKRLIPGEPEDQKALKKMIDMPVTKEEQAKWKPEWPKLSDPGIEIGKAYHYKDGDAATVVAWGRMQPIVEDIADKLATERDIHLDVLDLRTIYPYDWDAIRASVERTGRVIFINEDTEVCNFGEHLLRRTCDELFYSLNVRPRIMAGKHLPGIGLSPILEESTQPQAWHVEKEIISLVEEPA